MNLYHYSIEKYETIRSKVLQEADKTIEPPSSDESGHELAYMKELLMFQNSHAPDLYDYKRSVSLFLEPIPKNLPSILHDEHKFWKSGISLWEYTIDSRDLPKKVPYMLAEAPEVTDLIYNKQDWTSADSNPALVKKYKQDVEKLRLELHLKGEGSTALEIIARKYSKGIANYYAEAYKLHKDNPEDGIMDKYAACVPHLMVYPGVQYVDYKECNPIKLK